VGGVGDQPPLAGLGLLEPAEHAVHRASEASDLIVGRRVGDAPVQGGGRDRVHLGSDRLHRGQSPADHDPGGHRHHRQQQRQADDEQAADHGGRLADGVAGTDDQHRAPS
jgi:hypothetical protein